MHSILTDKKEEPLRFNADGVEVTPEGYVAIIEAKYIGNPSCSPYNGTAPKAIVRHVRAKLVESLSKAVNIIQDPNNPLAMIEIRVNHESGIEHLESVLREVAGTQILWRVVVIP